MRNRNSFESHLTRIRARILNGDHDGALTECDLAEQAFGSHWRIDLNRGLSYTAKGRFSEAKVALGQVETHNIGCTDRFCLSQGAYIGLFMNAYMAGKKIEASRHIDVLLEAEPEDILGLFCRGALLELWTPPNHQLLDDTICDLRKAYALISNLPDEKFYYLKILRDISQVRADEMESRCRDTQKMYALMQIDAPTVDDGQDAVDASDLLSAFNRSEFVHMPLMSAGPVHLLIGWQLAELLLEKEEDCCWVEAVDILNEIEPLVQQHGDADLFAKTLVLTSAANLDIYTTREDVDYLDAAKSKLVDLLRLSKTHTLNNETLEGIEIVQTDIDNLTSASEA